MDITNYHLAGFPCLWIETAEPDRTTAAIRAALTSEGVTCATWDVLRGIVRGDNVIPHQDPVEAIQWLAKADGPTVLVASLLHRLTGGVDVQQAILSGVPIWKAEQKQLVVLAPPGAKPAVEIERAEHVLEQALPTVAELQGVVATLAKQNEFQLDADATAEALRGLTVAEAENLVALGAVRGGGKVDLRDLQEEAARTIRAASGGTLELARPAGAFDSLGGLEQIKSFCGRAVASEQSRGCILLGVPGTGKTAFALALGAETGLPVYLWDLGRLFGSLVGESEASARRTIRAIEAAGRCIVLIDEIEKGASGMSSGASDSGTTARTMATVLTWLSDRAAGGAYVLATCNDVQRLPPELTRAERWDATFFVDLPSLQERASIFAIHAAAYGITEPFPASATEGWTGAELKSLCRLASMLKAPLAEVVPYVVPLSRSRSAEIQALRDWAAGRCVPASAPAPAAPERARPRSVKLRHTN